MSTYGSWIRLEGYHLGDEVGVAQELGFQNSHFQHFLDLIYKFINNSRECTYFFHSSSLILKISEIFLK